MTEVRHPKRVRDKRAKIDTIVETTRSMIEERGYSATTTNHIARAAMMSIGLIYRYFPGGKDDIIREIARRDTRRITVRTDKAEITAASLPQELERLFSRYVRVHRAEANFVAAMDVALLSSPGFFEEYKDFVAAELQPGPDLISYLRRAVGGSDSEFESLRQALLQTIDSTVHRHVTSIRVCPGDTELAVYLTRMVLAMVRDTRERSKKAVHEKRPE